MSNIDKRALRKKLNRRLNDAFGFQRTSGGKHTTISLSIDECKSVIVALDELEAKDNRINRLEAIVAVAEKRNAELVHNHRVHAARLINERGQLKQRIAELEALAKSVKFDPIPMDGLGNKSDGEKHPYMFGAGYNSAVVHCESVLRQAFATAGIGKGE
ncbi:TPA: ead/Ea22-like family protein [Escherichia coli]|nr:ead/Ea22-like family protein [Escherichia coli]